MSKRALTLVAVLLLAGCATPKSSVLPSESSKPGEDAAKLYAPAKTAMERGDYSTAIKGFEDLEARYPYGPYAEQAQLDTAYAYYKQDESAAAVAAADRFIKLHPANPSVDYAWYIKGIAYYQAIKGPEWDPDPAEKAYDTLRTLVERFPNSRYAADARARMAKVIDILGSRNLAICKFYYQRQAYVAAADRCERVVTDYQLSPAREEALYYLAKSYQKLGVDVLARQTAAVLAYNYPNSPHLKDLRDLLATKNK